MRSGPRLQPRKSSERVAEDALQHLGQAAAQVDGLHRAPAVVGVVFGQGEHPIAGVQHVAVDLQQVAGARVQGLGEEVRLRAA